MILDTNALSAVASHDSAILPSLSRAKSLAVTIITLGEFSYGIQRSRHKTELTTWLEAFLKRTQILFLDLETLHHYARLRCELKERGTPIPANDCWIAALARQHRMPLLTRDRHFDSVSDIQPISW